MMRFKLIILLLTAAPTLFAEQLLESGTKPPQLIELFTSEGCSSCPPADRWLSGLVENEKLWTELVPLAFHVDYWDRLGWKDRFAAQAHTDRQRQYRANQQIRSVYTPGFVVAGQEWRGWFGRQALPKNLQPEAEKLQLSIDEGLFNLNYLGDSKSTGIAHVVLLGMGLETQVQRGENAGRKLPHDFVVLDWQQFPAGKGQWQGKLNRNWDNDVSQYAVAAWVEQPNKAVPLQLVAGYLSQ